ncbi:MAG TPA: hypothetical protein VEL76_11130 [Gemmataceae bacterium]|nr:hypothetical protein [Gemmataceae bacterium]
MIDSPLIKELLAKNTQKNIGAFLRSRFGEVPPEVTKKLQAVRKEKRLAELLDYAAICPSLEAFRDRLFSRSSTAR